MLLRNARHRVIACTVRRLKIMTSCYDLGKYKTAHGLTGLQSKFSDPLILRRFLSALKNMAKLVLFVAVIFMLGATVRATEIRSNL